MCFDRNLMPFYGLHKYHCEQILENKEMDFREGVAWGGG